MSLVASMVVAAACSGSPTSGIEAGHAGSAPSSTTVGTVVDYPDAITRELDRMASTPRPVEPSAMPPRHLDAEKFPDALVDRERIVFGGAPPDGIPPIDAPLYESASDVDWIEPTEPVVVLELGGHVRAYPVQVLIWHEIVNDVLGGTPVAMTYCPLCNSGVAFDRTVGPDVLDFGTSGSLYQANLVMYDRQSESLWTQFDGRAVIGTRIGDELDVFPTSMVAWAEYVGAHPNGSVLARDADDPKPYGTNPYAAYDQRTTTVDGFFVGDVDATLPPYARVVGVEIDGRAVAVPTGALADVGVAVAELADTSLVFWYRAGTSSALNAPRVADGDDVGATGVFVAEVDGEPAAFTPDDVGFVDSVTGTTWNVLGVGVDGPRAGDRLRQIAHVDTFWFSWATFRAGGAILDPSVEPTSDSEPASSSDGRGD